MRRVRGTTTPPTTEQDGADLPPERDLTYRVAEAVQNARTQRGLSQKDLASLAGVKQPRVSEIESANGNPTLHSLARIAAALGARVNITIDPQETTPR